LKLFGYLAQENSRIIYIELIRVEPAPPISGPSVRPECVKNIRPQPIAVYDVVLPVCHNLHVLFGKLFDQFPTSIVAAIVKHVDVITPPQSRDKIFLQNIHLVLNKAQSVNFHIAIPACRHIPRAVAIPEIAYP
jgi:hypothetical protein